jgi:hypothetical protein
MLRGLGGAFRLVVCAVSIALAPPAFAADEKEGSEGPPTAPEVASNCDLTDYKSAMQAFAPPDTVPDNNAAGETFGPIVVPSDGMFIEDIVLELDCKTTWLGDIIVRLDYDENSDGAIDVSTTVICRPGRTGACGQAGTGVGCGSDFETGFIYRFDDTAAGNLPTVNCSGDVAGGCYRPTGLGAGSMLAFADRTKGGRWWLFVSDNQGGDRFSLTSWAVHLKNTPVSITPTSWGQLKAIYR